MNAKMTKSNRKINPNKLNMFLDTGIALAFVVELEEHFTGLRIHELLGLACAAVFLTHILLHWRWVVNITRTFFQKLFHESRFNYILNLALLIDMAVLIVTGVLISKTLGLNLNAGFQARSLHMLSSQLSLIIVGLHVAMHWKWIATHARKYIFTVPARFHKAPRVTTVPTATVQVR